MYPTLSMSSLWFPALNPSKYCHKRRDMPMYLLALCWLFLSLTESIDRPRATHQALVGGRERRRLFYSVWWSSWICLFFLCVLSFPLYYLCVPLLEVVASVTVCVAVAASLITMHHLSFLVITFTHTQHPPPACDAHAQSERTTHKPTQDKGTSPTQKLPTATARPSPP